jgi:hypothetical protein
MTNYGIYDTQLKYIRDEVYESEDDAKREFADYWRSMLFDSEYDNFEAGEHAKYKHFNQFDENRKADIVHEYLNSISDDDILKIGEFKVVTLT